jgi:CBS domain-containing protein
VTTVTKTASDATPLGGMTVADGMTSGLISCAPEAPLRNVARLMATRRVHAIFVFDYGREDDETTELWGIVSDLDVAAAACGDIDKRKARDSAVTPLVTVASDATLEQAARLMAEHGISHLAVIDPSTHRPVGVLSTLDIARTLAQG